MVQMVEHWAGEIRKLELVAWDEGPPKCNQFRGRGPAMREGDHVLEWTEILMSAENPTELDAKFKEVIAIVEKKKDVVHAEIQEAKEECAEFLNRVAKERVGQKVAPGRIEQKKARERAEYQAKIAREEAERRVVQEARNAAIDAQIAAEREEYLRTHAAEITERSAAMARESARIMAEAKQREAELEACRAAARASRMPAVQSASYTDPPTEGEPWHLEGTRAAARKLAADGGCKSSETMCPNMMFGACKCR